MRRDVRGEVGGVKAYRPPEFDEGDAALTDPRSQRPGRNTQQFRRFGHCQERGKGRLARCGGGQGMDFTRVIQLLHGLSRTQKPADAKGVKLTPMSIAGRCIPGEPHRELRFCPRPRPPCRGKLFCAALTPALSFLAFIRVRAGGRVKSFCHDELHVSGRGIAGVQWCPYRCPSRVQNATYRCYQYNSLIARESFRPQRTFTQVIRSIARICAEMQYTDR